jgi:hypothetical protein
MAPYDPLVPSLQLFLPSFLPPFRPSILHAVNPPAVNPPALSPPANNPPAAILLLILLPILLPRSSRLDPHASILMLLSPTLTLAPSVLLVPSLQSFLPNFRLSALQSFMPRILLPLITPHESSPRILLPRTSCQSFCLSSCIDPHASILTP